MKCISNWEEATIQYTYYNSEVVDLIRAQWVLVLVSYAGKYKKYGSFGTCKPTNRHKVSAQGWQREGVLGLRIISPQSLPQ